MEIKNIFSIPLSHKNQASMRRRLIVFSVTSFLLIFIVGTMSFLFFMGQIHFDYSGYELVKTVEVERLRLEASVNSEIAILLKMAGSPLIKRFLANPDNSELTDLAAQEIEAYSRALMEQYVFWISDKDKLFHFTDHGPYAIYPESPEDYWYNMTLYETEIYNFNINYNPHIGLTNLWINVPVFDSEDIPIGIVGSGINISNFINAIYANYLGPAELYFFNYNGEITGARNIELVANKITIEQELGQDGMELMARLDSLTSEKIIYFDLRNPNRVVALGKIHNLGWYVTAIHHFTIRDALQTGMTILFIVMIIVIFVVFTVSNIFVAKLLKPLNHIVKEIGQISNDWDLKQVNENYNNNEIATLGEFLNMTILDPLTGIYNRRYFDGCMKKTIKSLSRTDAKLSLLMIDIDFFKRYNDTYGHGMGDICLKEVANTLFNSVTREEDFVARYGGEEFVVVLPNTDENGALLIAEKLLKKIRECKIPHKNNDAAGIVTVSIGYTTSIVRHTHSESDYITHADAALYKSKQNGRNRCTFEAF